MNLTQKRVTLRILPILLSCSAILTAAEPDAAIAIPTLKAQCSAPFSDNAVLQRGIPLPVRGTSLPQAKVTVSFGEQKKTTVADKDGGWRVILDPLTAIKLKSPNEVPEGKRMTISTEMAGKTETAILENLVVGDVWLCAGQSNMAGGVRANTNGRYPEGTLTEANYPGFRHTLTTQPDAWVICTPENCHSFKQVAFFFGRDVYRDALVPIGIVAAAVGGSNIESWLNQQPYETGGNYRKLIAPIVGYGIRGMVWYQGESNTKDGLAYQPKLTSLIGGWRKAWNQGDFPFYIVQLPGMGKPPEEGADPAGGGDWPDTRQAQFQTLAVRNTGMAVTIDIGDTSVHPPNKYDTGTRLARLALHNDYGFTDLVPTGPLYESQKIEGDAVRIKFRHAGNGLMFAEKNGIHPPQPNPEGQPGCLAIQAKDGTWHRADGRIDGSELLVSSKDAKEPVAVRYAYVARPVGIMLYNRDGLPAAPFTTAGPDGEVIQER